MPKVTDQQLDEMNAFIASRPPLSTGLPYPSAEEFFLAASEILWVMEGEVPGATEPGTFMTLILRAMQHADEMNLATLGTAYPAHASGVLIYRFMSGGPDLLRRWAEAWGADS